ncbi:hypothetical protein MKW92_008997, partial [Papaver armeniacum]
MEAKFVKYWGTTPILFGLGSILDPRLNLKGVESTLYDIEECFGILVLLHTQFGVMAIK